MARRIERWVADKDDFKFDVVGKCPNCGYEIRVMPISRKTNADITCHGCKKLLKLKDLKDVLAL